MSPHPLTDVLRGLLAGPEAVASTGDAEIERQLGEVVAAGMAAWPGVRLAAELFVARLAHHYSNDEPLMTWLGRVCAGDLYLASACAEQVPGAIETLDREFLGVIPAILARGGMRELQPDEIRQRVRERLFVGASRIADYSGRGALASWLKVVTLRIAIDATREQRSQPLAGAQDVDDIRLAGSDPELKLIKERYREPFKQALRAGIGTITSEQRNLLRLHFVDAMTLDQLAVLFHVHRATIARRIAQTRDAVFDHVRSRLQGELRIGRAEFDELLSLLRSRLELSLTALLPTVAA